MVVGGLILFPDEKLRRAEEVKGCRGVVEFLTRRASNVSVDDNLKAVVG